MPCPHNDVSMLVHPPYMFHNGQGYYQVANGDNNQFGGMGKCFPEHRLKGGIAEDGKVALLHLPACQIRIKND